MKFSIAVIALLSTSTQAIRLFEEPAAKAADAGPTSIPRAAVGDLAKPVTAATQPTNDQAQPAISDQVGGTIQSK